MNDREDTSVTGGTSEESPASTEFSENLQNILRTAKARALQDGRQAISELDLVHGFARNSGATGEILAALSLDTDGIDPYSTEPPLLDRFGPLEQEDCDQEAWLMVRWTAAMAARAGTPAADEMSFFFGILKPRGNSFARRLRWLGIEVNTPGIRESANQDGPRAIPDCSPELDTILRTAQTIAGINQHETISPYDLVAGFAQSGGGRVGEQLRRAGVRIEDLVSEVIQDNGDINLSRFDGSGRSIIEKALRCASRRSHRVLGRRHLLYAMLCTEDGRLATILKRQGLNPDYLAEMWYAAIRSGGTSETDLQPTVANASPDMVKLLFLADADATSRGEGLIGELQLLRAIHKNVGEEAERFMAQHGVKWSRLLDDLS